jgi:hypothetical protein
VPWLTWTKLMRERKWQVCVREPDGAWRLAALLGKREAAAEGRRLRALGLTVRVVRGP